MPKDVTVTFGIKFKQNVLKTGAIGVQELTKIPLIENASAENPARLPGLEKESGRLR